MSTLRILHITRNLPPLVGGMERLNWHMAHELSKYASVQLIGPQGTAALAPPNVAAQDVPLRPLSRFVITSGYQAIATARRFRPHVVLAGSGLTAPAAWLAARTCSGRAFVYLHGLDAAVRHPLYQAIWHPAIRHMDGVIVNSQPTGQLALQLGVHAAQITQIHPGVQIPESSQTAASLQAFRQRYDLGQASVLLSVGRLTERKGLREFVQHALPTIVRAMPDTVLAIIGEAPSDALLAGVQTRASIQAMADAAGIGRHLRFLGVITDPQQLACAYESATVHVFPVRQLPGDPEGFGMVAVEAAAHGLPTVAFATGGVVDAISEGISGHLVAPHSYQALAQKVMYSIGHPLSRSSTRTFAQRFAWESFGQKIWATLGR